MSNNTAWDLQVRAYAKINLLLDVTGRRDDGYHEVATVMQQISLYDDIEILWQERSPEECEADQDG